MRTSPESRERSLLVRSVYLWIFIPAVVLLSVVVFAICFLALVFGHARAGNA